MKISVAEQEAIQSEITGNGTPIEARMEKRILEVLEEFPNITVALLRSKCAFRLNPVFDRVVRRLIEEGKVQAKAIKLELSLSR
jgi:hypothetical protein